MSVYADTSFLISYYISDSNTLAAETAIHSSIDAFPFTGLHRLEMRNALALGTFRGMLTARQVNAAWSNIVQDLRNGQSVARSVNWIPIFRAAAQSAALHSPTLGCRSLDVLHVSLARRLGTKTFFTFDTRQKTLANSVGMTVKP